jgi:aldehyde dehydrogenase (NAD+)
MLKRVKAYKVGDPFDPATDQGPQVSQEQCDRVMHYIDAGQKEGASMLAGGKRVGKHGYFVEPTLFDNVTDDMKIARDEIFGPVMNILSFKDFDEVARRGNQTFYGLAAALWTRDIKKAHRLAATLRAGTVWINCYDVFDAAAPFGGFKMSGIGRELGEYALSNYTEVKTVTVNLA